jgi:threonine dehydratase
MPKSAPLVKVQSCERNGAEIILFGDTFNDAFTHAQELCAAKGYTFIPPFNHPLIIAGQASVAHELLEQSADFDSVIVPVGGGGLLSGMITVLRAMRPDVYIMGVQSSWAVMYRDSGWSGLPKLQPMTIADGIAVKQLGDITGPIIKAGADKLVSVNEQETAAALIQFLEREHAVVEGSAAVTLAALNAGHLPGRYKKPVLMVSGSNIDVNLLARLLGREMSQRDRLLRLRASLPDRPGVLHFLSGVIANEGANVLEVTHDRSFAREPGNVEITLVLEIRDAAQKGRIISLLETSGIPVSVL